MESETQTEGTPERKVGNTLTHLICECRTKNEIKKAFCGIVIGNILSDNDPRAQQVKCLVCVDLVSSEGCVDCGTGW